MLHKILSVLVLSCVVGSSISLPVDAGYVRGYYRKNGTYVRPHYRSNPGSRGINYTPSVTPLPPTPPIQYQIPNYNPNYNPIAIPLLPVTPITSGPVPVSETPLKVELNFFPLDPKAIGSCEDVVVNSIKDLQDSRNLQISIELKSAKDTYGTTPKNRPFYYFVSMSGNAVNSIFNSPQLLTTVSRRIINKCPSISAVAFGRSNSGEVYTIGIFPNQEVDFFQCVEHSPSNFNNLRWGQEYCDS
ncbi:hypothetical protein [Nostoc flagelliforme]|uniref:hypothetical protein n=1 Tax=Nostoc flagelliforme TaxID=1306274 RepID=UPI0018F0235F|nr:hypothetical protein [Nostoc flagelliforme]